MTRLYIISGFLGAGKTTFIQKLLREKVLGERVAIIENEFGEVGIDGGLLKQEGLEIKEISSGCICCSLVGDFTAALKDILKVYKPEKVLIEPSGVGKLSDVLKACHKVVKLQEVELGQSIVIVDGLKYKLHSRNFSAFFNDQIGAADHIIVSRSQYMKPEALNELLKDLKKINERATFITTPWEQLTGKAMLAILDEKPISLEQELLHYFKETSRVEAAASPNSHKIPFSLGKKYGFYKEDIAHKEKQHKSFEAWSLETSQIYTKEGLYEKLGQLGDKRYGEVLRAKGIVEGPKGQWLQFDFIPEEATVQPIANQDSGKLCVIGKGLQRKALEALFR